MSYLLEKRIQDGVERSTLSAFPDASVEGIVQPVRLFNLVPDSVPEHRAAVLGSFEYTQSGIQVVRSLAGVYDPTVGVDVVEKDGILSVIEYYKMRYGSGKFTFEIFGKNSLQLPEEVYDLLPSSVRKQVDENRRKLRPWEPGPNIYM